MTFNKLELLILVKILEHFWGIVYCFFVDSSVGKIDSFRTTIFENN